MSGAARRTDRGSVPQDDSKQPSIAGGAGGPGEDLADDPSRVAEDAEAGRRPRDPAGKEQTAGRPH